VKVFAPAKLNFGLSVLGVRSDGYHELHSLMVPLDVGDELEVHHAPHLSLVVRGANLPTDDGNLVYRAARAYLDAAGAWEAARIVLHKHLPLASGVGGGSSDAASTLMALATLYPANVNLPELARTLGADVPFFLLRSAGVARGIGERLRRVRVPVTHVVLANPGVEVSARDAYAWLDETAAFTKPLDTRALLAALAAGGEVPFVNALQDVVAARHPEINAALQALRDAGLRSPLMSGSGSTCFALASTRADAERAAAALCAAHPNWWVRAATAGSKDPDRTPHAQPGRVGR